MYHTRLLYFPFNYDRTIVVSVAVGLSTTVMQHALFLEQNTATMMTDPGTT